MYKSDTTTHGGHKRSFKGTRSARNLITRAMRWNSCQMFILRRRMRQIILRRLKKPVSLRLAVRQRRGAKRHRLASTVFARWLRGPREWLWLRIRYKRQAHIFDAYTKRGQANLPA